MQLSKRMIVSSLSLTSSAFLFLNIGGPAANAAAHSPHQNPGQQIVAAYNSSAGQQTRAKLVALLSDPALPKAAHALLASDGPTGTKTLTSSRIQLIKALITVTKDPKLLAAKLEGKSLTPKQHLDEVKLRGQLEANPAVQALSNAGRHLRNSPALSSDLSAGAAAAQTSYSTLTPPPTAGQGGNASLDAVLADFSALRASPDFDSYASQLHPALSNPDLRKLIQRQSPLTLAAFLSPADLQALQLHGTYTTSLVSDLGTAVWDIIGPIAVFAVGLYFLPAEVPLVLALATFLGAIYTGEQVAQGVITIANDLDCDHDGDPFDPADAPGQEC